jgi:glycosyltransferase involved in cell wall biosynthesis
MPTALILTYHFPPSAASGSFRLLGFARHLSKFDWRTVVVAAPGLPWEPVDPGLSRQVPPETVIYSVPYPSRLPKVVRWAAPYAVWLPWARAAARRAVKEQHPDIVLTSGPPHWIHLLGRFVQRRYRIPWVADFRDPWVTTNPPRKHLTRMNRWERFWERRVLHHADVLIGNAPNATALFREAYTASAHKAITLTNGYDPESFAEISPPRTEPGVVRILHAGQLYMGRDPRPLLDAIQGGLTGSGASHPFRIEFMGRNEYEKGADLEEEVRQRGLTEVVRCTGQLGYRQTLEEMCRADILLLLDSPGRHVGVPAKLYEYLGAGRPVLCLAEDHGDVAAILRASGVPHRIVPPADRGRIRQALMELVGAVASGSLPPANDEQRLCFSREALAGQLADVFNSCIGRPRRSSMELVCELAARRTQTLATTERTLS